MEIPCITYKKPQSDCERVNELFNEWKTFHRRNFDEDFIRDYKLLLTEISHYVTLIGFDKDGDLGIGNIDATIQDLQSTLNNQRVRDL